MATVIFPGLLFAWVLREVRGATSSSADAGRTNPVQKAIGLLSDLETRIKRDSDQEASDFAAYMEWCRNGARDKEYEVQTAESDMEDLQATIGQAAAKMSTESAQIQDLGASVATNTADLQAAQKIRDQEQAEFETAEKELVDAVDTLERAINILQRKLHGSALLQAPVDRKDVSKLIQTLGAIIDAAALSVSDRKTLLGLVQSRDSSDDGDLEDEIGAPAPEAYKAHTEGIIDVLEDLKQKADTELADARKAETNSRHNFEMLKQSLEDQNAADNKQLVASKQSLTEAAETKASAEGDLAVTQETHADAKQTLQNMDSDCKSKEQDHQASVAGFEKELKALAEAKEVLIGMTTEATAHTYGNAVAASFLQVAKGHRFARAGGHLRTNADLAHFEVANLVRKLARDEHDAALAQLAGRISNAMREGAQTGEDPFVKVKGMISDMIDKLEAEASSEATHKAYCDKEMAGTKQKLGELKYDVEKYTSSIDKKTAQSVTLKNEVSVLQQELAALAKLQAQANEVRTAEHKTYLQVKADLELGLKGVRMASRILRDYYASHEGFLQQPIDPQLHEASTGSGTSIISMLEVVESDFSRNLASVELEEDSAATAFEKLSMETKVSTAVKSKDVEYKTQEAAKLDKEVAELSIDREGTQTELEAVLAYSANIRGMCELKPETYEERSARRHAEIEGLKEALNILEGSSVFTQVRSRLLRGTTKNRF